MNTTRHDTKTHQRARIDGAEAILLRHGVVERPPWKQRPRVHRVPSRSNAWRGTGDVEGARMIMVAQHLLDECKLHRSHTSASS